QQMVLHRLPSRLTRPPHSFSRRQGASGLIFRRILTSPSPSLLACLILANITPVSWWTNFLRTPCHQDTAWKRTRFILGLTLGSSTNGISQGRSHSLCLLSAPCV